MKILFIGNSYTYVNSLFDIYKEISFANGVPCEVKHICKGGFSLKQFTDLNDKLGQEVDETIKNEKFDYVVLQDNSVAAIDFPGDMQKAIVVLKDKIDKNGAKIVLYQTWGRHDGSPDLKEMGITRKEMTDIIEKEYTKAAKDNKLILAKVGRYFYEIQGKNGIDLYHEDKTHPSYAGSYLAALVIYKAITEKSSEYPTEKAQEILGNETEKYLREAI